MPTEFVPFTKIARLSRDCVITEKIDGTNASITITDEEEFLVGSRNRFITPEQDNYGFAAWAYTHRDELLTLGPGTHYGEWWGCGIQRGYGLKEKRFSLFNTYRWCRDGDEPKCLNPDDKLNPPKYQQVIPACCHLVPVLYNGEFDTQMIRWYLDELSLKGSQAAPGFLNPEGIIIYHTAAKNYFKKTIKNDEQPKSLARP